MATKQEEMAEKVSKLLRQAESTNHPAEAETFTAAAYRIMTEYAIDEELLARFQGVLVDDKLTSNSTLRYTGIYYKAMMNIAFEVARNSNLKAVYSVHDEARPKYIRVTLHGFESDITKALLLCVSLEIQAVSAMKHWTSEEAEMLSLGTPMEKFKAKRDFFMGFASGVGRKLEEAAREAARAVQERDVARGGASDSVALVLRSKKSEVEEWFRNGAGRNTRAGNVRMQGSNTGAHGAGVAAGRNANMGGTGVGRGIGGRLGR